MNNVINWGIIYFFDVIKMSLIIYFLLGYRKRRKVRGILFVQAAGLVFVAAAAYFISYGQLYMVFFWTSVLLVSMYQVTHWKKAIILIPVYLAINILDSLISNTAIFFSQNELPAFASVTSYYIIINFYLFLLDISLIGLLVWLLGRKVNEYLSNIRRCYIGISSFGLMIILFMTAIIQPETSRSQSIYVRLYGIIGPILFFGIYTIVCLAALHLTLKNRNYKENLEMNEKLVSWQKQYFHSLLDREKETKRFRHDMAHHLYYIEQLCHQEKWPQINEYISELHTDYQRLRCHVETGNETLNIIVKDIFSHPSAGNIHLKWSGCFPDTVKISRIELCILFSNLLSNAVEAVTKCPEKIRKEIKVSIKSTEYHLYIRIINPVSKPVEITDNILKTTKSDQTSHGFGTENIKKIVEEYGGDILYHYEDYSFQCEVFFSDIFTESTFTREKVTVAAK